MTSTSSPPRHPSSTEDPRPLGDRRRAATQVIEIHNPADWPDANAIEAVDEPWIDATIYLPDEYLGAVLKLCQDRRGVQKDLTYVGTGSHARAMLRYELPLNEVVFDFYDRLKSISRGYASFDYHQIGHREGDLVKMSILVNAEPVDALSMIVHRANAEARGRGMCERLKDLIPRHLFKIPIQAAIGGKIIARETIAALRKDVTAKCYGGDATRKRKLLEKQKEGKKRMREYGVCQHSPGSVHRRPPHGRRRLAPPPIPKASRERAGARGSAPQSRSRVTRLQPHTTPIRRSLRHDLQQFVPGPRRPGRGGQAEGAGAICARAAGRREARGRAHRGRARSATPPRPRKRPRRKRSRKAAAEASAGRCRRPGGCAPKSEAELKAARDARYAARKTRK